LDALLKHLYDALPWAAGHSTAQHGTQEQLPQLRLPAAASVVSSRGVLGAAQVAVAAAPAGDWTHVVAELWCTHLDM
jgi:hypothetical protein